MSQCVALIPARGGSKRLPRKNIIDFRGKPILAYSIEAALETERFDQVVVSTEDDDIADIAQQYGALVNKRSPDLAMDTATVDQVCLDYVAQRDVSVLVVLYATAPLRTAFDIQSTVDLLSDHCHFSIAATLCEWPVHQTLKIKGNNVAPVFPDLVNCRLDEVGDYCIDNGSTYAVHVDQFLQQKTFYGDSLKAYLMPSARSIDIDTLTDYYRALDTAEKLSA